MPSSHVACRCCRVPVVAGAHLFFRVCPICVKCDERHGMALHHEICKRLEAGKIDPYLALAVSAFDDAWICGKMTIDGVTGLVSVKECPKRWEVVIAWARVLRQPTDMNAVIGAVLAPFMGLPNVPHVHAQIAAEMKLALCTADPTLADVVVEATSAGPAVIARDEIVIRATAKAVIEPEPGGKVIPFKAPEVELPPDILSRPRGSA